MAAANFLILYSSKVGSSAIISSLSAQKGIRVPLIEDLDQYRFKKTAHHPSVSRAMRDIFETGVYENASMPELILKNPTPFDEVQSIGFKWRYWGDLGNLAKFFKANNISIFVLTRKNFLNFVCSFYVQQFGAKHLTKGKYIVIPQFSLFNMSGIEKWWTLLGLARQNIAFDEMDFVQSIDTRLQLMKHHFDITKFLSMAGVKTHQIFYEDFDNDPVTFIRTFVDKLGLIGVEKIDPYCAFSKSHKKLPSERINQLKQKLQSRKLNAHYTQAKKQFEYYQKEIDCFSS